MTITDLKQLVRDIVAESQMLAVAHIAEAKAPVNYACIFAHSEVEYDDLVDAANRLGSIVQDTETGPVFHIAPIPTVAGILRLLKIRKPDPKRPERGDADFTIANYESFKEAYLGKPGFDIIRRPNMEMVELIDPFYDVIAYFSHPTLAKVLKINLGK